VLAQHGSQHVGIGRWTEDSRGYDETHVIAPSPTSPPSSAELRARFDAPAPLTVGLEEEYLLLDGETLDLAPRAAEVLTAAAGATALKLEMPAAQLEVASAPAARVDEAIADLAAGRRAAAAAAERLGLRVAAAAVHPFAAAEGPLNAGERYAAIERAYGTAARRQLLSSLHVHVRVSGADRALAVYNALRGHLPDLAALAACAPYYEGRDTGLASVRPLLAALLPRQGIPPQLSSWEVFAGELDRVGDPAAWWWELRPHRLHGTLELRVPDVQPTLADARAVAAVAHALVGWLVDRYDAGEPLEATATWILEEARWEALRHGPTGAAGERLATLLDAITPTAERLGCAAGLNAARLLADSGGGAARLRAAAGGDVRRATGWLAERFSDGVAG
jgi:carboxylate-amine ligase